MKAEEIRQLNEVCQQKGLETGSLEQHTAALASLGLSLLAELTAQVAESKDDISYAIGKLTEQLERLNGKLDSLSSNGQLDVKVWER